MHVVIKSKIFQFFFRENDKLSDKIKGADRGVFRNQGGGNPGFFMRGGGQILYNLG